MTIYVNFNRELIIDGFGSKVQFVNKLLSLLFNCQVKFRKRILANDGTQQNVQNSDPDEAYGCAHVVDTMVWTWIPLQRHVPAVSDPEVGAV